MSVPVVDVLDDVSSDAGDISTGATSTQSVRSRGQPCIQAWVEFRNEARFLGVES